jgi:hypothetical protein
VLFPHVKRYCHSRAVYCSLIYMKSFEVWSIAYGEATQLSSDGSYMEALQRVIAVSDGQLDPIANANAVTAVMRLGVPVQAWKNVNENVTDVFGPDRRILAITTTK